MDEHDLHHVVSDVRVRHGREPLVELRFIEAALGAPQVPHGSHAKHFVLQEVPIQRAAHVTNGCDPAGR